MDNLRNQIEQEQRRAKEVNNQIPVERKKLREA